MRLTGETGIGVRFRTVVTCLLELDVDRQVTRHVL